MPLVLGLDISANRVGWAVLQPRGKHLPRGGCVTRRDGESPGAFAARAVELLLDELAYEQGRREPSLSPQDVVVAVEVNRWPRLAGGRFVEAFASCCETRGRVLQLLEPADTRLVQASNEPKDRRRRRLELKYGLGILPRGLRWSQDAIDALSVADALAARLAVSPRG